jgi:hypothetical protein
MKKKVAVVSVADAEEAARLADLRPFSLPPIDDGTVTRLDILGGIIQEYERVA